MHHLTGKWASLSTAAADSVFNVSFLVWRKDHSTPEDTLAAALTGLPVEPLTYSVTRGATCSVRLRFHAPDEATARDHGEQAMAEAARWSHGADSLIVRRGRAGRNG